MRTVIMAFVLTLSPALLAATPPQKTKKPAQPVYVPDPKQWRVEIKPDLGGWQSEPHPVIRIKVVDPHDPNPPSDEEERPTYYDDYEGDMEDAPEKSADQLRNERLAREAEEKRNAWRERKATVWFNGQVQPLTVSVGHSYMLNLDAVNGENRFEVFVPDAGKRVVRTWWVSSSRTRLRVSKVLSEESYVGNLEVLEPGGELATAGRRTPTGGICTWGGEYTHSSPPPGTYTLRWTGGWRGAKPCRVTVEAVLDGGTDQERRWRFERVVLAGAGPVTLGTVDVED